MVQILSQLQSNLQSLDKYLRNPSDPLTTTQLRLGGFVNDVGEAGKAFLPKSIYYGTYLITGTYAIAAVWYARKRMEDKCDGPPSCKLSRKDMRKINHATIDNAIWHTFATVSLTPALVHGTKVVTKKAITNVAISTFMKQKTIPTIIGLASIAVWIRPVDNGVTYIMNQFRSKENQQGYHWDGLWSFLSEH